MDEMELLKQILESSEDVEIPESLKPENIEKKLREKTTTKTVSFTKRVTRYSEMAAAVCVLIVAGFAMNNLRNSDTLNSKSTQMEQKIEQAGEMAEKMPVAAGSIPENSSAKSVMAVQEEAYEMEEAYEDMDASYEEAEEAYEDVDAAYDYGTTNGDIYVMDAQFSYQVTEDGRKILITEIGIPDQVVHELCLKDEISQITDLILKEHTLYVILAEGIEAKVDVTDPADPVFISNKLVWE